MEGRIRTGIILKDRLQQFRHFVAHFFRLLAGHMGEMHRLIGIDNSP